MYLRVAPCSYVWSFFLYLSLSWSTFKNSCQLWCPWWDFSHFNDFRSFVFLIQAFKHGEFPMKLLWNSSKKQEPRSFFDNFQSLSYATKVAWQGSWKIYKSRTKNWPQLTLVMPVGISCVQISVNTFSTNDINFECNAIYHLIVDNRNSYDLSVECVSDFQKISRILKQILSFESNIIALNTVFVIYVSNP